MRYFPRNMRTKKISLPMRYKGCRPKIKLDDNKIGYDYRREFDLLIDDAYNGISAERRKVLWTLTGSLLINQKDKNQDPHIKLKNAFIQAHENLPE